MMNKQEIITEYLKNILPDQRDWETELITYAKENRIPIIEPVSMRFITQLIKLSQPEHILEIGTAIGYSALSMHHALPKAKITTLERDDEMISQAKENFAKYSRSEEHTSELQSRFDLVHITYFPTRRSSDLTNY